MATVSLPEYSEELGNQLDDLADEFKAELDRLQATARNIAAYGVSTSMLADEVGKRTFHDLSAAKAKVAAVSFTPLPQKALFDASSNRYKARLWQTQGVPTCLNDIEAKIVSIVATADSDALHNLNAIMLPDTLKLILLAAQEKSDRRDNNTFMSLLTLYSSPDEQGNRNWLTQRYNWKREDRARNVFTDMFELAQANMQWALKANVTVEEMHMEYTSRYNGLIYDITAANIAAYKADILANVAQLELKLKDLDLTLSTEAIIFEKESSEWEMMVKRANEMLAEYLKYYGSCLTVNSKMLDIRIDGGKAAADGYGSIFNAWGGSFVGISKETAST